MLMWNIHPWNGWVFCALLNQNNYRTSVIVKWPHVERWNLKLLQPLAWEQRAEETNPVKQNKTKQFYNHLVFSFVLQTPSSKVSIYWLYIAKTQINKCAALDFVLDGRGGFLSILKSGSRSLSGKNYSEPATKVKLTNFPLCLRQNILLTVMQAYVIPLNFIQLLKISYPHHEISRFICMIQSSAMYIFKSLGVQLTFHTLW